MTDWDLMVVSVLRLLGKRGIDQAHAVGWLTALVSYAEQNDTVRL